MALPNPPSRGDDILAWAIRLTDHLRSTAFRGAGLRVGSGGSTLARGPSRAPATSPVTPALRRPFQLVAVSDEAGSMVKIISSTIDGELPDDFSLGDDFLLSPHTGSNYVFFHITLTEPDEGEAPEVDEIETEHASTIPPNSATDKYVAYGEYTYTPPSGDDPGQLIVSNYAYGPGITSICRDWFSTPATYSFSLSLE